MMRHDVFFFIFQPFTSSHFATYLGGWAFFLVSSNSSPQFTRHTSRQRNTFTSLHWSLFTDNNSFNSLHATYFQSTDWVVIFC